MNARCVHGLFDIVSTRHRARAVDARPKSRVNIMSDQNWYTHTFKGWQGKLYGSKPTAELLASIHNLGARPGKQAMACAMALRPEGVTNAQIVMVCGAPQLNKMRGFITDGLLKRVPVAPDANGHSVYKLELTGKGSKRIETTLAWLAKAAEAAEGDKPAKAAGKPKGKAKAKKAAKAKPAETPVSEPAKPAEGHVPVNEPVTADQPQA